MNSRKKLSHDEIWTLSDDGTPSQRYLPSRPKLGEPIQIPTVEPDLYTDLGLLVARRAAAYKALDNLNLPNVEPIKQQLVLRDAADLLKRTEQLVHDIAIESVNEGMSRVETAKLLGIHQGTIAKWIKEGPLTQQAPLTVEAIDEP